MRMHMHTLTHHPNCDTRKNRQIYKTKPLCLPLPNYSPPRQTQAPDMDKLKKTPLPTPSYPHMQVLKNTCDTYECSKESLINFRYSHWWLIQLTRIFPYYLKYCNRKWRRNPQKDEIPRFSNLDVFWHVPCKCANIQCLGKVPLYCCRAPSMVD